MSRRTPKLTIAAFAALDFLVITGLSGAGKSQAIHAVEDLGYYCVDNLPVELLPDLHALHRRDEALARVAVVVDIREKRFLTAFPAVYARLRATDDLPPSLIFLEASAAVLHRRFSETRRPHPMAPEEPIADAIALERRKMARIRAMADEIVDTSDLTVHELRQVFLGLSRDRRAARVAGAHLRELRVQARAAARRRSRLRRPLPAEPALRAVAAAADRPRSAGGGVPRAPGGDRAAAASA